MFVCRSFMKSGLAVLAMFMKLNERRVADEFHWVPIGTLIFRQE